MRGTLGNRFPILAFRCRDFLRRPQSFAEHRELVSGLRGTSPLPFSPFAAFSQVSAKSATCCRDDFRRFDANRVAPQRASPKQLTLRGALSQPLQRSD